MGAYLSVVDYATGDPTFIAFVPRSPAGDCRLTIALDQGASQPVLLTGFSEQSAFREAAPTRGKTDGAERPPNLSP